jgi:hypothetical protein
MSKTKQVRYEEAVARNLLHFKAGRPRATDLPPFPRDKCKSMEEAKRIVGIRESDTSYDEEIRQYVEA